MTVPFAPPAQYSRFVSLVRNNAPRFPIESETELQRDRAAAGRALGALQALADGLNVSIPTAVGIAGSAATSNGREDFANAMIDTAITEGGTTMLGAEAGPFIGGALMLARGTYQSLSRTDAMVRYLLGNAGLTNTLARLCVSAMRDSVPYTRMPNPPIPDFARRSGDLFSGRRREAYLSGFESARRIIQEMDSLRPTSGDHYSKRCLIFVGIQTGFTGRYRQDDWRLRVRCERVIIRDMLALNLRERAERLRRWANAA